MADTNPARQRIGNDSAEGATIHDTKGNPAYSPEALKILKEQGVNAYRQYLAKLAK